MFWSSSSLSRLGCQGTLLGSVHSQKPKEPSDSIAMRRLLAALKMCILKTAKSSNPLAPTVLYSRVPKEDAWLVSIQVPAGRSLLIDIEIARH